LLCSATARAEEAADAPADEAAPKGASAEPVVVIDLRTGDSDALRDSRATLERSLSRVGGIELTEDSELSAALSGERPASDAADRALARAQKAYGAVDCTAARTAARDAIARYAAQQAEGEEVGESLRRAYVYELLCANSQDDFDAAQRAANRLRILGAKEPPQGVSEALWKRYPAVDAASNVFVSELTVSSVPPGARVWIDHALVGDAPVTAAITQGEHLVAAATDKGSASRFVEVGEKSAKESLSIWIEEKTRRWDRVRRTVAEWKSGESPANAIALGVLMKEIGVRFAFVLAGTDQVEVWAVAGKDSAARRLGTDAISAHFRLASIVLDQIAIWEGRIDEASLLGDGATVVHAEKETKKPQKWWVYASIIGAVALGTGVLLMSNLADDHQRIELTWP